MKLLWDQCKDKSMLLTFINNHRYINQAKFIPRKDQKKEKEILTIFPLYGGELSIFLSIFLGFFLLNIFSNVYHFYNGNSFIILKNSKKKF